MNRPRGTSSAAPRRPGSVGSGRARSLSTAAVLALAVSSTPVSATDYIGTPESYLGHLGHLGPGDRLLLQPGQYRDGLALRGLLGTPDAPITIQGPASGAPAVFLGRANANTVSIRDSAHVVIRHLVLDGRNLSVDAVKAESRSSWAHDITLEYLLILNHGNDQQTVGISAQSPAWNWTIRHNVILGAGTGMYFGSSDGRHPFVHGVVEHNLVLGTLGYNLQIKHQRRRPDIGGLPVTDGETVIRGNVFEKGSRSSRDQFARPNVLVGHFPDSGPGIEDRYLIEGNLFFGNPAESLFQGEGNITLAGNLFVNPYGDGIAVQPHHAVPRRIEIARNFIAARGVPLRVLGTDPRFPASVHDNAIVGVPPPEWDRIDEDESPSAARLRQAVARWMTMMGSGDEGVAATTTVLKQALNHACSEPASELEPVVRLALRAETERLCALISPP